LANIKKSSIPIISFLAYVFDNLTAFTKQPRTHKAGRIQARQSLNKKIKTTQE
jgi:hypothetical protein